MFSLKGPIICDFGGLPRNSRELSAIEFENLLDAMPGLKMMTISPRAASKLDYEAVRMLHERYMVAWKSETMPSFIQYSY